MVYAYTENDTFYDVESLSNVFTTAWWFPNPKVNAIILSYLDDDHLIKNEQDENYIRDYIYRLHPRLKKAQTQIVFENLSSTGCINDFVGRNGNTQPALGMQTFAKRMGLTNSKTYLNVAVNKRGAEGNGWRYDPAYYPVKQTDPDYDANRHGYRFGYNSTNYDLSIIAHALSQLHDAHFTPGYTNRPVLWDSNIPIQASQLRAFNDDLFDDAWRGQMAMRLAHPPGTDPNSFGDFTAPAWIMRKGWLLSGRYIDVSRLNEKLQKVGLKRLLGMLGLRIMESDKLDNNTHIDTLEQLADLIAYNISDVVNLQTLFEHKVYQNSFNVRGKLLETYPQTVYDHKHERPKDGREPQADVGNYMNIRRDRLARDSTSAKFVELAIAPYTPIKDIETVSFMYPSKIEAKKLGITPTDILEDTKAFFEKNITSDPNDQAHKDFMQVYAFYDHIRGENFNASKAYKEHYGANAREARNGQYVRQLMSEFNTNLFYQRKDENGNVHRTSCLANFSIGGIHGAEINTKRYNDDMQECRLEGAIQNYVESLYPSAVDALNGPTYIRLPATLVLTDRVKKKVKDDGTIKIREFVKSGSTKKKAEWRAVPPVDLFKKAPNGNWTVQDKYSYVSTGPSHHEDFTSYYPLLLSRLSVFINPQYHGYKANGDPADPYYDMFLERAAKKKQWKDKSLPQIVRDLAGVEQESRKLLINAASGAGDATFDNNIRANNAIISMRIIGQLFAWRIGQAEALAGARVPSTNTDGLYTMDISAEDNDRILTSIANDMHIGIEPERLDRFVTKDSNNRLEVEDGKIASAKGGTLNSWKGPQPTQSLDHAAIIDHILAKYLAADRFENPADEPFDRAYAEQLIGEFIKEKLQAGAPQEALKFFQWIIASATSTHRYAYAKLTNVHTGEVTIKNLQHYNRIFLIKFENADVRQEIQLATRRVIDKNTWAKRQKAYKSGECLRRDLWQHDADALQILMQNGLDLLTQNNDPSAPHYKDEAKTNKIRTMPANQHVAIFNQSIVDVPNDQAIQMINALDLAAYVNILEKTFQSWSNQIGK